MNTTDSDPDHAPAILFVRKALEWHDEPMSRRELQTVTKLPKRTVNYALNRLQRTGEVDRVNPDDRTPRYEVQNR